MAPNSPYDHGVGATIYHALVTTEFIPKKQTIVMRLCPWITVLLVMYVDEQSNVDQRLHDYFIILSIFYKLKLSISQYIVPLQGRGLHHRNHYACLNLIGDQWP